MPRSTRTLDESLLLVLEKFEREDEPTITEIAAELGMAVATVDNYLSRAWSQHRTGKRPRRPSRPPVKQELAPILRDVLQSNGLSPEDVERIVDDPEEREFAELEERLRHPPENGGHLEAALERVAGRLPEHTRSPAPGAEPLRHAPTFAGFKLSRQNLLDRLAVSLARTAGHRYFDEMPAELQEGFRQLAEKCVAALELIEADLKRIRASTKGAWHQDKKLGG